MNCEMCDENGDRCVHCLGDEIKQLREAIQLARKRLAEGACEMADAILWAVLNV